MITSVDYAVRNGRIFAIVRRESSTENEVVTICIPTAEAPYEYTKYLPNVTNVVEIDLTPYCEAYLRKDMIEWVGQTIANDYSLGTEDNYSVKPYLREDKGVNGTAYYRNCGNREYGLLTKLPYLQLQNDSPSESYELLLCFHCPGDDRIELRCGDVERTLHTDGYDDIIGVRLQVSKVSKPRELVINSYAEYDYRTNFPIRIVQGGMNTRRLVWLNEVGGIDSWSFEFLRESNFATTSEVFYSSTDGYTRLNRKSERLHTVETRELDDLTAEVVAYVIASPEVYVIEDGALVPIDIVTEECRTYSDTELSGVQVSYRKRKRE